MLVIKPSNTIYAGDYFPLAEETSPLDHFFNRTRILWTRMSFPNKQPIVPTINPEFIRDQH